jgi:hypothetical protein
MIWTDGSTLTSSHRLNVGMTTVPRSSKKAFSRSVVAPVVAANSA